MQREMRRCGDLGFDAGRLRVGTGTGRAVPQGPVLNFRRESEGAPTLLKVDQESTAANDCSTGSAAAREAERPLADVLLIAEDLLLQAKRLARSCVPREAVETILDQVAALREDPR